MTPWTSEKCGEPAWRISKVKSFVYRNSPSLPTRAKVTSPTFIEPWLVHSSFKMDSILICFSGKSASSSQEMYAAFLEQLQRAYKAEKVKGQFYVFRAHLRGVNPYIYSQDGRFGAMMNVSLTNEVCSNCLIFENTSWNSATRDLSHSRLTLGSLNT